MTDTLLPHLVAMGAARSLDHVRALDEGWARLLRGERPPSPLRHVSRSELPLPDLSYDVVYAGGGLGLLHALGMRHRGYRVLLFDRRPVGEAHREWNSTRRQLGALVEAGLFTDEELESVVAREYRYGFLRFHDPAGAPLHLDLPGVLDLAVDAGALLRLARRKFEEAGGTIWDGASFEGAWLATDGAAGSVVEVRREGEAPVRVGARQLVNAMGALSPLSLTLAADENLWDGVCPTVGTVARGFAEGEIDPTVGEILVTLEGQRDGRQLIWEGFPAHGDTFTTYLFYYDVIGQNSERPHSLSRLFEEYFALLPTYKRPGPAFAHLKPVYGFIPARHHLDGDPVAATRSARGLISIGDAAGRQNPLTFTGFGAFVRGLPTSLDALDDCLRQDDLEAETLAAHGPGQENLGGMWVLARFLSRRAGDDDVNAILRDFTLALWEVGPERAASFFLDLAPWRDYVEIMLRTARHRPQVLLEAFQVLGARGVARWLEDLARWYRIEQAKRRTA